MRTTKILAFLCIVVFAASCASKAPKEKGITDLGLAWVKHAEEFRAVALTVYQSAEKDLEGFIADTSWSALPEQTDAAHLPPAIIFDVDETVLSNIDFQLDFEPPFENWKLDEWNREHDATPIPGFAAFVEKARAAGVEIFFVTNRPCERDGLKRCPQRRTTIKDIAEVGVETDKDHVFLSYERGWTREKSTRRSYIARTHRVIMLFGDDLGDFIPCVRKEPIRPCTESASGESRTADLLRFSRYWGSGWYVLPNPTHGSWTRVLR